MNTTMDRNPEVLGTIVKAAGVVAAVGAGAGLMYFRSDSGEGAAYGNARQDRQDGAQIG